PSTGRWSAAWRRLTVSQESDASLSLALAASVPPAPLTPPGTAAASCPAAAGVEAAAGVAAAEPVGPAVASEVLVSGPAIAGVPPRSAALVNAPAIPSTARPRLA